MIRYLLSFLFIFSITTSFAQKEALDQVWPAKWIMAANGSPKSYGVQHFRKAFELETVPEKLIVHTSGDNRYQLFINGEMVTLGPQRGDLRHWYYESTDIAPWLQKGKNVIAAHVLNYGAHPPDAQLTVQTGFLLAASDKQHRFLNTPKNWKAKQGTAYSPNVVDDSQVRGYYGGGSREIVDGNQYLWGWQKLNFDDSDWQKVEVIESAFAKTCKWASRWKLTPRTLQHEKLTPQRFEAVRLSENITVQEGFVDGESNINIPPNTKAHFVLDWGYVTTAYPVLQTSKGKNAGIKLTYVETPYIGEMRKKQKGNRNEVKGKNFIGYYDRFIADGGEKRTYQPFWWRGFRYIMVEVETKEQALAIEDMHAIHSTYPFEQKAQFDITIPDNPQKEKTLAEILTIGDRTIRANSHEHFMDCPYYEESQFEGDTRVEALISYYNYGDSALGKNAIEQFSWSINEEGFLSARYPTNSLYYIPNYSLYWIGMLYDYMMLYDDLPYIKEKISVSRMILNYYERNEREGGTVKKLDYHQFVDWSFKAGEPPMDEEGYSAINDLHYLLALQWALQLEKIAGNPYYADSYQAKIDNLKTKIKELYWDANLQLFTDVPDQEILSQHTNCLAIITGITQGDEAKTVMQQVLSNKDMTQATLYWSFYVSEAMKAARLGDVYMDNMHVWESLLELGVTTWPETGANSRSECHGWGANPNYHLYKIVAGISSTAPGFKEIEIAPSLGKAEKLEVALPHPNGFIKIDLQRRKQGITGEVTLPQGTSGKFVWGENKVELKAGRQTLRL